LWDVGYLECKWGHLGCLAERHDSFSRPVELDLSPRGGFIQKDWRKNMYEKIYVVPLDENSRHNAEWLGQTLSKKMGFRLQTGIVSRLPDEAYNSGSNQYYAVPILAKLELLKGTEDEIIVALTEEDLYIPSQNFVFGQANSVGRTAIISTLRLKPEYYGLPENEELLRSRLLASALHELGHLLGLKNCSEDCVMKPISSVNELDRRSDGFCPNCLLNLTLPTKVKI
jgi:archaemetzincin